MALTKVPSLSERLLRLPRAAKRIVAVTVDIMLCLFTVALAYRLRLDEWIFPIGYQWLSYGAAVVIAIPLFIRSGLYRAIFRYVGWGALMSVVRACGIYAIIYAAIFTFVGFPLVPRTTGVLQPILLFLAIGGSRAIARYWLGDGYMAIFRRQAKRQVLIYGAGSAGRQLAAGLGNGDQMHIAGFVDDDAALQGSLLDGKMIHPPAKLAALIEDLEISDVLLAIPSASRQRRNEIVDELRGHAVTVRMLPGITDLAHGRVTVNDLKPLDIEDLLGRDPVPPAPELLSKCVRGKVVMVTGAGGSIGSELCRQILAEEPSMLLLYEQSEFNLYSIEQELLHRMAQMKGGARLLAILGSVQDEARIDALLEEWKPETIYHAAAYKHVPLVEQNPAEGVRNNIFGTLNMARMADRHGVKDFVLISTDKAVRPPNVMGATKRVAEMLLQAMSASGSATCFSMVRFGNVLGSSGSVVPLFRKQIAAGGPLTVTHPEITRYFMTIPEAAQLVIQAGAMAEGGEVFVLDMGEPVRIIDLARRMIELSGLSVRNESNPNGDIAIEITGLRPAEKLYEELLIDQNAIATSHQRIMMARDMFLAMEKLESSLQKLQSFCSNGDDAAIRAEIRTLVPEFGANGTSD